MLRTTLVRRGAVIGVAVLLEQAISAEPAPRTLIERLENIAMQPAVISAPTMVGASIKIGFAASIIAALTVLVTWNLSVDRPLPS